MPQTQIQQDESGFTIAEDVRVAVDTRTQYDSAIRLLEQKDYEQGIALLLKVTEAAPDVTAPYIDLGIAYGRSGDLDKGIASLKRALELSPAPPGRVQRARHALSQEGRFRGGAGELREGARRSLRSSTSRG